MRELQQKLSMITKRRERNEIRTDGLHARIENEEKMYSFYVQLGFDFADFV